MILVSLAIMVRHINEDGFEVFVQKRAESGELDQLWEFPGGKIAHKTQGGLEDPQEAAIREWEEEVGTPSLWNEQSYLLGLFPYVYASREVMLYAYVFHAHGCKFRDDAIWQSFSWQGPYDKTRFPAANHQIIDALRSMLQRQSREALEILWPKLKS